jgi:putative endonuclease
LRLILTNRRKTVLYTGVTNDLVRRLWEHRHGHRGFAKRYHRDQLVWYEVYRDSYNAISREKQIKAGSRRRKIELIERSNPAWRDLSEQLCVIHGIASGVSRPRNDCLA